MTKQLIIEFEDKPENLRYIGEIVGIASFIGAETQVEEV